MNLRIFHHYILYMCSMNKKGILIGQTFIIILAIIVMTLICIWVSFLLLGKTNYDFIENTLNSFFGKFLIISIVWSFSFQILSEVRHLFWDMGIGFELKTSNISGLLVIIGSFILTIFIFTTGKNFI